MYDKIKQHDYSGSVKPASGLRMIVLAVAMAGALPSFSAHAGATMSFGEDKSISLGMGMRTSYTSQEKGAPDGSSRSGDFSLDSVRLYLGASMSKNIKATFNTERNAAGNINLLDGYAQFDMMPEFNVWIGRMLPPSDRANLDGPYYLNAWSYPGVVSQYPAIFAGRDEGVLAWGKVLDQKLVYSVGVFQGRNRTGSTTSNQSDNLLYAGRVAVNFWSPEPAPAYYTGSTYYGAADILTVGLAALRQKDGVGNSTVHDDYSAWNLDVLMEKKLDVGVATLEGAYYKYDFAKAAADVDVSGGVTAGKAYLAGGAFLFPAKVGMGQFQPYVRLQKFTADITSVENKQSDVGVNYVIDGANAKLSATYSKAETTGSASKSTMILGMQLQF